MAHNLYLQMLSEVGIIGFTSFMAIALLILYQLWQLQGLLFHRRPELSNLASGFFFSILTYLISGIFLHLSYQRYYWFLLAVGGAAIQILKSESSDENVREVESFETSTI
jgi:O-antigen ligase